MIEVFATIPVCFMLAAILAELVSIRRILAKREGTDGR